ncbi:lactococcin 972 family bacteriocin [Staphylococcus aureus]|uniref:lactococcin 972 family bacteriocin n=1 Tax=Staphylococcus aureus TaxID=1280 RepID=UPI003D16B745
MKKKFVSSCIAKYNLIRHFIRCNFIKSEAATVHVAGGVWSHGIGKHYVWSYYSHNKRNHGSTAVGKYSSLVVLLDLVFNLRHLLQRLGVETKHFIVFTNYIY